MPSCPKGRVLDELCPFLLGRLLARPAIARPKEEPQQKTQDGQQYDDDDPDQFFLVGHRQITDRPFRRHPGRLELVVLENHHPALDWNFIWFGNGVTAAVTAQHVTGSLLDRLIQHVYIQEMNGDS